MAVTIKLQGTWKFFEAISSSPVWTHYVAAFLLAISLSSSWERKLRPPLLSNFQNQLNFSFPPTVNLTERGTNLSFSRTYTKWSLSAFPYVFPHSPVSGLFVRVCTCGRILWEASFLRHQLSPKIYFISSAWSFPFSERTRLLKFKSQGKTFLFLSFWFIMPPLKHLL